MVQLALKIAWRDVSALEFVPIDRITRNGQQIKTVEYWYDEPGKPEVSYIATVEERYFSPTDKNNLLRLSYMKRKQKDSRARSEGLWGECIIKWNSSRRIGEAHWIGLGDEANNNAAKVTVLGGQAQLVEPRKNASVIVKLRPNQAALRGALLYYDKCCVLTKEREKEVLDAAHIVQVMHSKRDNDNIYNAILLRADLHRLFDAGLFWFEVREQEAVVRYSKGLSRRYARLLEGKKLANETFKRVEQALRKRAKQPGGQG